MSRLKPGDTLPDFSFCTPYEDGCRIRQLVREQGEGNTAVVFLRYYGCTLCQYDIHLYTEHYKEITAEGGNFCVVLQSQPKNVRSQIGEKGLPFPIICDPEGALYREFEILPAKDMEELAGGNAAAKIMEARKFFTHKEYEGEELQLPAVFVADRDMKLVYVKYGENAGDVPKPEELKILLAGENK